MGELSHADKVKSVLGDDETSRTDDGLPAGKVMDPVKVPGSGIHPDNAEPEKVTTPEKSEPKK